MSPACAALHDPRSSTPLAVCVCSVNCGLGQASFWSAMFVVLATVVGLSNFFQVVSFNRVGVGLTTRLQKITFEGKRQRSAGSMVLGW